MSTKMPTPPRVAFVDPETGLLTRVGDAYIRALFTRVGETTALTNTELATFLAQVASSEMVLQTGQASPLFPDILQPASADAFIPDVLQSTPFADFGDTTFQH